MRRVLSSTAATIGRFSLACRFGSACRYGLAFCLALASSSAIPTSAAAADEPPKPIAIAEVKRETKVDFAGEVLPILEKNCTACHNTSVDEGGLKLEDPAQMLKGGERGPAVIAGKPAESLLLKFAAHQAEPVMPPEDNDVKAKNLSPAELGLIKLWIEQGAEGKGRSATDRVVWQPLPAGVNPINAVAITPDGQYIACGRANQIFIYHAATGRLITRLTDPALVESGVYKRRGVADLDLIQALAFDPTGERLASGGFRAAKIWRRPRNVRTYELAAASGPVQAVAVSADGKWLATGAADHSIKLFDLTTGKPGPTLAGHAAAVTSVRFATNNTRLVSGSLDGSVRIWNLSDGSPIARIDTGSPVNTATFYGDESTVASGGSDNNIRLWSIPTQPARHLADLGSPPVAVATSNDQKWLAVAGADGKIRVIELASGKVEKTLEGPATTIASIAFSSNNARLAAADGGLRTARVWDLATGQLIATVQPHPTAPLSAIAIHPNASHLIAADATGGTTLFKLDLPAPQSLAVDQSTAPGVAALSPDGKWLATAGMADGKPAIVIRDVATGQAAKSLTGHEGPITALAWSGDGSKLVSGSADKTARVWNIAENKEIARFGGHGQTVTAVAFNGGANQVASGAADNSVKTWSIADGAEVKNFAGHAGSIVAVAFWSNDSQIISASADQKIKFWNPADGAASREINRGANITAFALSRDGQKLAVAGADNAIKLYQTSDGKELATLAEHSQPAVTLSFSPDHQRLVSTGKEGLAFVWDLATNQRLEVLPAPQGGLFAFFATANDRVLIGAANNTLVHQPIRAERSFESLGKPAVDAVFYPDGNRFAVIAEDGTLRGYQIGNPKPTFNTSHGAKVFDLAISLDGRYLATAGENKTVRVWNSDNGGNGPKPTLEGFRSGVTRVGFSPDNQKVLGGTNDGQVLAFSVAEGTLIQAFLEHGQQSLTGVATYGPKGEFVATSAADGVRLWTLSAIRTLAKHSKPVTALAVVPNQRHQLVSGSEDGQIRIWDTNNGNSVRDFNHGAPVTGIDVRPDGQRIVSTSAGNTAKLWKADNGQMIFEMKGDYRAQEVVAQRTKDVADAKTEVTQSQQAIAAAEKDLPTKTEAAKKAAEAKTAADKAFAEKTEAAKKAAEEKMAADKLAAETATAAEKAVAEQKAAEQAVAQTNEAMKKAAEAFEKAKKAAEGDANNADLAKAKSDAEAALTAATEAAKSATDAKQKADQAVTAAQKSAKEATDKAQAAVKPATDTAMQAKTAEDEKKKADKAAAEADTAAKLATAAVPAAKTRLAKAEAAQKEAEQRLAEATTASQAAEKPIRAVAYSADGLQIATAGDDNSIHTWDGDTGRAQEIFSGHAAPTLAVAFTPDGRGIVSGSADGKAYVWDQAADWQLERTIGDVNNPALLVHRVLGLAFSPDGRWLATGGGEPSRSGELKIWNVADGTLVREIPDAHSDTVFSVDFSADGKLLASSAADKFVKVFATDNGQLVKSFEGHTHHVLGVTWQAKGKQLASCGADNVIKIWNLETGEQSRTIQGFSKQVTAITFVGDSEQTLSASGDSSVRLHNANNGQNVRGFGGASDYVNAVAVTPDGLVVVAGGQDSIIRIWNGTNGNIVRSLEPPKAEGDAVATGAK